MHLVGQPSNKVSQFSKLHDELFSAENDTNKKTSPMLVDMGVTASTVLLAELQNKNKATVEHLSRQGKVTVNDPVKRSFGTVAAQLQCFGCIGSHNAGGVSQVQ
eukprot:7718355-Ditylum_brightwellii.AAC.1